MSGCADDFKQLFVLYNDMRDLTHNGARQAENNAVHLQILEAVEASETWEASICQEVQSLEDEIDSTKLSLQQETRRAAQKELELQQLQVEAAVILNVDGNATRPCDSLPERSAFQLDAEPLMAKDESLTESLYHCRRTLGWRSFDLAGRYRDQ